MSRLDQISAHLLPQQCASTSEGLASSQTIVIKVRSKAAQGHLEGYNKALKAISDLDKQKHPDTLLFSWDFDESTGLIDLIEMYPSSDTFYLHYKDADEAGLYTELQKHIDFEHSMEVKIIGPMKPEHKAILVPWGAKFLESTGGFIGNLNPKDSRVLLKVRSKSLADHVDSYNNALGAIADLDKKAHPETEAFIWDYDKDTRAFDLTEIYPSSAAWYMHYKDGEDAGLYTELQKHIDFEHGMDVKIVGPMEPQHKEVLSAWGAKFLVGEAGGFLF